MAPRRPHGPIAPYMAIGLSTIVHGIAERKHIMVNLDNIEENIHAAVDIVDINMPVKLIALAEGALTGFTDEAYDLPHGLAAKELFIEIPGPETDRLSSLAREHDTYIVAQCKARWPEIIEGRFFNMMFVISPKGKIVHRAAKNHVWSRENSCTPHDIYDRWVEVFGEGIEAFYPVLRTDDIGNIGTICCSDGEYPEAVRALALNGAELVYRPSEAMPMTGASYPGGGGWMVQNRGHAQFNSVYMVCPNVGPIYLNPKVRHPVDIAGGNSHIVDYLGNVLSYSASGANTMVAAFIDIEALRNFRTMNLNSNWTKDLRTEVFRSMYDEPIHPKNLYLRKEPYDHERADRVAREDIQRLIERGAFTPPAARNGGAKYHGVKMTPTKWKETKRLWDGWGEPTS